MKLLMIMIGLSFAWPALAQEAYVNPIDGKKYIADWKTYKPQNKSEKPKGRVENAGIVLLSTQEDIGRNASVKDIVKLINFAKEQLTIAIEPTKETGAVLLQISLNKDKKPKFDISHQGSITQDTLQRFYNSLGTIDLTTKEKTVTLQVAFKVNDK